MANKLLPIKVVLSREEDYQAPEGVQSRVKYFGDYTDAVRVHLTTQLDEVQTHFDHHFRSWRGAPAVAKVQMKKEAIAKSYRPVEFFRDDICPVIGANRLGELYVSVAPAKIASLRHKLSTIATDREKAQLTAIASIRPYSLEDAIDPAIRSITSQPAEFFPNVRYRLFRHRSDRENRTLDRAFDTLLQSLNISLSQELPYASDLKVFRLANVSRTAMAYLSAFGGTQSVSLFPDYHIVRTAARVVGHLPAAHFQAPEESLRYGVVGLIDSGTDPSNPRLQAWVVDRHDFVPRSQQDHAHGSFVAGLIAQGRALNHGDPRFPTSPAKIIDYVAIDRDGEISEFDLLAAIDDALTRFPHVRVWNLSLGLVGEPCQDAEFSLFASALDERARRHGVLFIIAAGNYDQPPLRPWPPTTGLDDRIRPPADAVRAITVGSLAHAHTPSACVPVESPSPFTRRGPGPGYLTKPELSHYGGNCTSHGDHAQIGILSLDAHGHLAENIGTSFACPLVSCIASNVIDELEIADGQSSPTLAKALLLHSGFLKNMPHDETSVTYRGLGTPDDVTEILSCREDAATLIIQAPLRPRPEFGKRPFPIPPCLQGPRGRNAEIYMTLLYDPEMDRRYGVEYCRSNITVSLGTCPPDPAKPGKTKYHREVPPYPKSLSEGYESDLVKNGYKWSPFKLYHRRFRDGLSSLPWRLTLEMLNRAEEPSKEVREVVLIISIRSADPQAPVYTELLQLMERLQWGAHDLQIRSRTRLTL